MSRTTWPALALDRFLSEPRLSPYVRVFGAFDVRDDAGGFWHWLADASIRDVAAWCKRMERAGWQIPAMPGERDLPWVCRRSRAGGRRR